MPGRPDWSGGRPDRPARPGGRPDIPYRPDWPAIVRLDWILTWKPL